MGPLKLTDLVGLDVRLNIAEYLHRTLASEAFRPPEVLRRMVNEGELGKKSGEGFIPGKTRMKTRGLRALPEMGAHGARASCPHNEDTRRARSS